ncbi:hypothetical protein [Sphingobium cupriresistens]|uniref:hypothetical protein n=1 Tax=Sphingobium cupriresistens TaxID=1132417 RepID=UPI000A7A8194|nr:hypothetical protein [Sphingobium cupriresistens]
MSRPLEVNKTSGRKLADLKDSLMLIHDCCKNCRDGKLHYIPALAGQLRSILSEKRKDADALIKVIADSFNIELNFFVFIDANNLQDSFPDDIKPEVTMSGFPISSEREINSQTRLNLDDFLNYKILKIKENSYSVINIIKWFSDRAGGSHYSKTLPKDFSDLLDLGYAGFPFLIQFFIQIGEAVVSAGYKILAKFSNQDICLIMGAHSVPKNFAHIIDCSSKFSKMRTILHFDENGKFGSYISGIQGENIRLRSNADFDFEKPMLSSYH